MLPTQSDNQPVNCFLIFCREKRDEFRRLYPDLNNSEITSKLGKEWRSMSAPNKEPYKAKARQQRKVCNKTKLLFSFILIKLKKFKQLNPSFRRKVKSESKFITSFRLTSFNNVTTTPLSNVEERVKMVKKPKFVNPATLTYSENFTAYSPPCPTPSYFQELDLTCSSFPVRSTQSTHCAQNFPQQQTTTYSPNGKTYNPFVIETRFAPVAYPSEPWLPYQYIQ